MFFSYLIVVRMQAHEVFTPLHFFLHCVACATTFFNLGSLLRHLPRPTIHFSFQLKCTPVAVKHLQIVFIFIQIMLTKAYF